MSKKISKKRKMWLIKKAQKGTKLNAIRNKYKKRRLDPYYIAAQVEKSNVRSDVFFKNFQKNFLDPFNKKYETDIELG